MKKFIAIATMTAMLLSASAMTAFAASQEGTTDVKATVAEVYAVAVTAEADLGTIARGASASKDFTAGVKDAIIKDTSKITVTAATDGKLTAGTSDVVYTLQVGAKDAVNVAQDIAAVDVADTGAKNITYTAAVAENLIKYAGDYTDTITFTFDVAAIA